jgi:hypothetical protein
VVLLVLIINVSSKKTNDTNTMKTEAIHGVVCESEMGCDVNSVTQDHQTRRKRSLSNLGFRNVGPATSFPDGLI